MTYYPRNPVYCRVPIETVDAPRRKFRVSIWQACVIGCAFAAAIAAIVHLLP